MAIDFAQNCRETDEKDAMEGRKDHHKNDGDHANCFFENLNFFIFVRKIALRPHQLYCESTSNSACLLFLSVCCCKILQALERGLLISISKLMKTCQNYGKFLPTVIFEKLARRAAKETR